MEIGIINIFLFVISGFGCFLLWVSLDNAWSRYPTKRDLWALLVIAALVMPFNIGGNVWTIAGNARSENGVYSLFSVYQSAERDAFAMVNAGYQSAGTNAGQFLGIAVQNAGTRAVQFYGIAYQNSGEDAVHGFGIAFQNAEADVTQMGGIAVQNAGTEATQGFGIAYQNAGQKAINSVGLAFQKVPGKVFRPFAVFSTLEAE